jgi:uncharacterized membrane protein YeaQ/YmgE (transglycosylase-associated protein family)
MSSILSIVLGVVVGWMVSVLLSVPDDRRVFPAAAGVVGAVLAALVIPALAHAPAGGTLFGGTSALAGALWFSGAACMAAVSRYETGLRRAETLRLAAAAARVS